MFVNLSSGEKWVQDIEFQSPLFQFGMDIVRVASKQVGKVTAVTVNKAGDLAEAVDLKGKQQALNTSAVNTYESTTGRSIETDKTIAKYTTASIAGAAAVSFAPVVLVGGAIAAGAYIVAKPVADRIGYASNIGYSKITGRDASQDVRAIGNFFGTLGNQIVTGFQQGQSEINNPPPLFDPREFQADEQQIIE